MAFNWRTLIMLVALPLMAACTTTPQQTAGWGQVASGVGVVVGDTRIDPQIAKVSAKLAEQCVITQTALLGLELSGVGSAAVKSAVQSARITVNTFCAAPPRNVGTALVGLASAYAGIVAARQGV